MAPAHPNPTTFLTLPHEIRRKIYIHVLTKSTSEAIRIVTTNDNGSTHSQGKGRALLHGQPYHCKLDIDSSLLFTGRQINSEANPLLYAGNRFHFINEQSVEHFLGDIGSHNVRLIRRVQVPTYSIRSGSGRWSRERLASALCSVPNLEEVSICCKVHFGEGDCVDQTDAGRNLFLARTLLRAHNKLEACLRLRNTAEYEVAIVLVNGRRQATDELVDIGLNETMLKDRTKAEQIEDNRQYSSRRPMRGRGCT